MCYQSHGSGFLIWLIKLNVFNVISVNLRIMKEILAFLIFSAIVGISVCNVVKVYETIRRNCYLKYLATSEYHDDEMCETIFKNHIDDFHKKVSDQMNKKDNGPCIKHVFNKYNFQDIYLRGLVKNYLSEAENKTPFENTIELSIEQLLGSPRLLCHSDTYFEEVCDQYANKEHMKSPSELSNEDLCIMKYFINHGILNKKVLDSIWLSRLSEAINCEDPMEIFDQRFPTENGNVESLFDMPRVEVNKCIQHSMKNLKTSAHLYSIEFALSKFELNDEQKDQLKKLFTNMITTSIKMTNKCISKI